MNSVAVDTALKFHLSLNVNDLEKSVQFLTILLGGEPKKCHADYAKFEPDDLPLVLSLEPRRGGAPGAQGASGLGSLNHLGFRMSDPAALVEVQKRLELAGISTLREEGVECCYARQTKFWVRDPDANLWEIYVLEGDIEHRGAGQAGLDVLDHQQHPQLAVSEKTPVAAVWAHRLDEDFPDQFENDSLDEIYLQGTFNSQRFAQSQAEVLAKARTGLRPGGKLTIHVLTTDRSLDAAPALPGLASIVTHVPLDKQLLGEVQAAGFVGLKLAAFGDLPCFNYQGVEMRETQLVAWKPGPSELRARYAVLYKGPFAQVTDEAGVVFPRGQKVNVDAATRDRLKQGAGGSQFAFFGESDKATATGCCG